MPYDTQPRANAKCSSPKEMGNSPNQLSPSLKTKNLLAPSDDSDESDSDVEKIIEAELGFKLDGEREIISTSVHHGDDEFDDDACEQEVQMELIKLMAKKKREATKPLPQPEALSPCNSPLRPDEIDPTGQFFRTAESLFRSLHPEVQAITKRNLNGVMEMAKAMDENIKKNKRLFIERKVLQCYKKSKTEQK